MYLRISRVRSDSSKCDEVLAAAKGINPALRQLPGFQSSYWGVDRASGAMIAVSTWDTREHAGFRRDALESAAADSRRMEDAGAQMDPPEVYEIAAQVS
jgi:heme-degrading monooxygenase HmoA